MSKAVRKGGMQTEVNAHPRKEKNIHRGGKSNIRRESLVKERRTTKKKKKGQLLTTTTTYEPASGSSPRPGEKSQKDTKGN